MKKDLEKFVVAKTQDLLKAPSACPEVKAAATAWLKAVGTKDEAAETKKYLKEIEEDILPIDDMIAFVASPEGTKLFGAEAAKKTLAAAKEHKAKGGKYCICPACTACAAILSKKAELLK
ncbi:MAG: molecular chaperone Hsp90 [Acidaminococcaceae bacterium]|jgi:hypothetical protein|nr:molecular chaperone Hsp90 [Acidaminococcaceae bacterium]